ncbi:ventricular zone-expressed PH domain-containing protein homolog 1-like [Ostrea edulis]|uniref:ventricular zone-expressed PH domain-containing protein homolog 1-like n=1 Tax=Ostrea edulis TaxID=37623 RepID=UPI0024AFC6AD|nr:ventricular zone-expressed PH domain-containing protein homolog 1-like [Ostrea edulis]
MHELFAKVLNEKDLSKAGDLFSLEDRDIVDDISTALEKIGDIINTEDYVNNDNDQSVVEICITRVTTTIREMDTIEDHSSGLVRLLQLCQQHNLNPVTQDKDPPHAKVASDIMSCLFTHYSKSKVMKMAIPVVVNFLGIDNKELSRNVSSYLSLAALDNADLLAKHMEIILNSIFRGNYILSTVLPQIYAQNSDPIIDCTDRLTDILDQCDVSERSSLFQVFSMVAKNKPKTLEPHIHKLSEYLSTSVLAPLVLVMFVDMAIANPKPFVSFAPVLKASAEKQPIHLIHVLQIMGAIGTINEEQAQQSMAYFVSNLNQTDQSVLTVILQEVKALSLTHPELLVENMDKISKLSQSGSSAIRILVQQLKDDEKKRSNAVEKEMKSVSSQTEGAVTVITVGNPPNSANPNGITVRQVHIPPSSMSSQQSLGKSSRASVSTGRYDRPVSPSSIYTDRMSMISSGTASSQHGPSIESMRDGVQHFCDKHFSTIRNFISNISARIPLPEVCSVINGRHKRFLRLSFLCGGKGDQCIYSKSYFTLDTKLPKTWIHLMFLSTQAKASSALSQHDYSISRLKTCWDSLQTDRSTGSFLTLVTSSFPSAKDQDILIHELHSFRFFDVFEFNAAKKYWACFMCNHPEKMWDLMKNGTPVIAGQLREKKGRWKFLKRWKTRYFTLSGTQITYSKSDQRHETLPVSKIQSVKAVRKGYRDIPKAFEIFTADQTYTFKAKGHQNIEQWVQCLHIAVAQAHKGDNSKKGTGKAEVCPSRQDNLVIERPRSVMDTKL